MFIIDMSEDDLSMAGHVLTKFHLKETYGVVLGLQTVTAKNCVQGKRRDEWKVLSVICKWRTFDFFISDKDELIGSYLGLHALTCKLNPNRINFMSLRMVRMLYVKIMLESISKRFDFSLF